MDGEDMPPQPQLPQPPQPHPQHPPGQPPPPTSGNPDISIITSGEDEDGIEETNPIIWGFHKWGWGTPKWLVYNGKSVSNG